MDITYLGQSSFKIKGKATSLITDPFDGAMLGMKFTPSEADIVTISHHHPDHDKIDNVTNVKKIVDGPGEYEIAGTSIIGIASYHDDSKGTKHGKNTIYVIEIDGIRLLHLGDLGHKLTDNDIKDIGDIDILFLPVGGFYTIDAKQAFEVVKQVGASIIIPMHFKAEGVTSEVNTNLAPVDDFIKLSNLRLETLPKLVVKEGSITTDEEYIVVLEKK